MRIPITCEGCGSRFEVEASYAGRRGRCKQCGQPLTVPPAPRAEPLDPDKADVYHLDERQASEPSAYVAGPTTADPGPSPAQVRTRRSSKKSRSPEAAGAAVRNALVTWQTALISLAVAGLILLVLATLFPTVRTGVGMLAAAVGVILFLYGFASGAYIAFTEDFLYGFFFVAVPVYAAYYFVSRWDEMRSRLAMVVVGLVLMSAGAWVLELDHARPGPGEVDPAVEVMGPVKLAANQAKPAPR
jgi:hypothetical protein